MAGSIISTIGSSVLGGVTDIIGGNKAGDAIQGGIEQGIGFQQAATAAARDQLTPFSEAGRSALERFQEGLDVDYKDVLAGIEDDPFYQFQLQQGLENVQGSAAAGGSLQSGRTLKAITEFSQGLASQQAQQALQRQRQQQSDLFSLAQTGFNADQSIANAELGLGSNLANLALASGENRADKISNQFNAVKNIAGGGLSALGGLGGGGGVTGAVTGGSALGRVGGGSVDFGTPSISF